ncbi:MAG: SBBP repeat-containing protein [Chitinophagaceae bacterium]|nr:SBBP repeat-containing protein [Chitinophagaceae bacterium]
MLILSIIYHEAHCQVSEEWVATHITGTNLVDAQVIADPSGNVFIAGTILDTLGSTDWLVVKYDLNGDLQWARTYGGSTNGSDYVNAIALDEEGYLYVCGSTATSSGDDYFLRKYDQEGDGVWSKSQNGTAGGHDHVLAIVTDDAGNVYITGESEGNSSDYDVLTIKYNSSGTKLWSARYNGTSNLKDTGVKVKVDASGNVYVAGYKTGTTTGKDLIAIKYNAAGNQQWVASYNNNSNLNDVAASISIDTLNNVYVTGESYNTASNSDFVTIKYNGSGTQQWLSTYDGTGSGKDYGKSVAIDTDLNVYVSGSSEDTSGNFDLATICYTSSGSVDWIQLYDGPASNTDLSTDLLIDVTGDVLVTAGSIGSSSDMDYLTLCYDNEGSLNWLQRYDGAADDFDQTSSLYIDELANIYIVGSVTDTSGDYEYVTIKYNQLEKSGQVLESRYSMLAASMIDVSKVDTVKDIVNEYALRCVDGYHHITFAELFAIGIDSGIDIKDRMNQKMEELYDVMIGRDHVGRILSSLHYRGIVTLPHIALGDYKTVDSLGNADDDPYLGYTFTREDFPIGCVNCSTDTIDRADKGIAPMWILTKKPLVEIVFQPQNLYLKPILNCFAVTDFQLEIQCEVCPLTSTYDGVPEGAGNGTNNHEIEIQVGHNDIATTEDICLMLDDNNEFDDAVSTSPISDGNLGNYAKITKVAGTPSYEWLSDGSKSMIRKLKYSIRDDFYYGEANGFIEGDALTLCISSTEFNNWGEHTLRFGLGQGGLFKIERPHTKQLPLYFGFPYAHSIWWIGGPDMRIYYGTIDLSEYCSSGRREIFEQYETRGCWFCDYAEESLGTTYVTDSLVSTDYLAITKYWLNNAITIGFNSNSNSLASVVKPDFYASSASTTCFINSTWDWVTSLTLNHDTDYDWYEVEKTFPDNKQYEVGDVLHVRVRAKYINEETIDECRTVTLANSDPDYIFTSITVQIRGNIKGYESGEINYQIDVYEP